MILVNGRIRVLFFTALAFLVGFSPQELVSAADYSMEPHKSGVSEMLPSVDCCDGGQEQWSHQPSTMAPATSSRVSRAVTGEPVLLSVVQYPQAKCNWCGASVAKSVGDFYGNVQSQTYWASLGGAGLNPPQWCACAAGDSRCKGVYDLATLLTRASGRAYTKYSYASQIGTAAALTSTIWDSLYWGRKPVAMNTFERKNSESYNYHNKDELSIAGADIGHYILVNGVTYGNLSLIDPAGNANSVLGWGKAVPYLVKPATFMTAYMPGSYGIYR